MRAGVTGHQDLGPPEIVEWVSKALSEAVEGYGVTEGLTSLAVGADQLYAEILLSKGIPYRVVVPCAGYEQTFQEEYRARYDELLSSSGGTLQLDFEEPSEEAFFEAGKRVVQLSDLVIAVWNGKQARGLGGTADAVDYALRQEKTVVHLNTVSEEVAERRPIDHGKDPDTR